MIVHSLHTNYQMTGENLFTRGNKYATKRTWHSTSKAKAKTAQCATELSAQVRQRKAETKIYFKFSFNSYSLIHANINLSCFLAGDANFLQAAQWKSAGVEPTDARSLAHSSQWSVLVKVCVWRVKPTSDGTCINLKLDDNARHYDDNITVVLLLFFKSRCTYKGLPFEMSYFHACDEMWQV